MYGIVYEMLNAIFQICSLTVAQVYEGQSKITEPYLITFESSKNDIYLDDISS